MTLVEFLLACIAEDERAAHGSKPRGDDDRVFDYNVSGWWDEDRVLAECEAKRRIVQMFADQLEGFNAPYPTPEDIDEDKLWPEFGGGVIVGLRDALRLLTLPYADRPGFREEWRA